MAEQKEQVPIIDAYGKVAFLKVKSALDLDDGEGSYGKMVLSFVNKNNSKQFVDCYMDVFEFNAFMDQIHTGELKELVQTKTYTSNYGGKMDNGTAISRYFTVQKSTAADYLFTGFKYPAEKTAQGAFVPKKGGEPLCKISVPIAHSVFESKYELWKKLFEKYLDKVISVERYANPYKRDSNQ